MVGRWLSGVAVAAWFVWFWVLVGLDFGFAFWGLLDGDSWCYGAYGCCGGVGIIVSVVANGVLRVSGFGLVFWVRDRGW